MNNSFFFLAKFFFFQQEFFSYSKKRKKSLLCQTIVNFAKRKNRFVTIIRNIFLAREDISVSEP